MNKHGQSEEKVEFSLEDRRAFANSFVNKKKRKQKEAKKRAEEQLRETRRERRKVKKEVYQDLAQKLVEHQQGFGIDPLPLVKKTAGIQIEMIEVDANKPLEKPKVSTVDINDVSKPEE